MATRAERAWVRAVRREGAAGGLGRRDLHSGSRRKKAKIERRERQKKRLSRSRDENSPETSLQAGKGRLEDDPK